MMLIIEFTACRSFSQPHHHCRESTLEFMAAVDGCESLAAVLAGHIHTAQHHAIGKAAVQYVSDAGAFGGYRVVTITVKIPIYQFNLIN